ncbi:hypothetical protein D4R99_02375 [bacterium]|nr:MAG: hypothetical protein D4R99_02375 [bacterium]
MHTEDPSPFKFYKRLVADFALLFSALFFPWWITLILIIIGAFFFENFYEAFFLGLFLDALYGTEAINFYGFRLFFATIGLFLVFFSSLLKKKVRFFS